MYSRCVFRNLCRGHLRQGTSFDALFSLGGKARKECVLALPRKERVSTLTPFALGARDVCVGGERTRRESLKCKRRSNSCAQTLFVLLLFTLSLSLSLSLSLLGFSLLLLHGYGWKAKERRMCLSMCVYECMYVYINTYVCTYCNLSIYVYIDVHVYVDI